MTKYEVDKLQDKRFEGGNFTVALRRDEEQENLFRRFARRTKKDRLVEEIVDGYRYKKPTTKRREAAFRKKFVLKQLQEMQESDLSDSDR